MIEALNKCDEHHSIDAKTASDVGPKIFETICAFANSDGGYILLGARRQENSLFYEVAPIPDPDKVQQDLITGCSSTFDRRPHVQVFPDELDDEPVLVVVVHPEQPLPTHLFMQKHGYPAGVVLRRGSTNYYCNNDDIPLLDSHRTRPTFDTTALERSSMSELDMDTVRDYRDLRRKAAPNAEEHVFTDDTFLESVSCIVEHKGKTLPTIAGMLMFGREDAIRKHFPLFQIHYVRVPGKTHSQSPGQGHGDSVRAIKGNLFRIMRRALREVLDDLPQTVSYQSGSIARHDTPTIHTRIAREVIVNAMMHRTYVESTAINIVRYGNRIEVTNPGDSLIPLERMGQGRSRSRNEAIAAMMRDIRWAETRGTGIGVLREKMQEVGLHVPVFNNDPIGQTFTSYLLLQQFDSPAVTAWTEKLPNTLTDIEIRACFVAHELGVVNCSLVQSLEFGSVESASDILRKLEKISLLEPKVDSSGRYYAATQAIYSPELIDTTGRLPKTTGHLPKSNGGNGNGRLPDPPEELRAVADALAGKEEPRNIRCAILKFCNWRSLRPPHLARYLDRSPDYLRRTFINDLLDERLLEMSGKTRSLEYRTTEAGRKWIAEHCGRE